ncbi:MAG: hypothetical protein KF773_34525 [Deltaproteobacteria bacterium]|nr:hypothetical protein [Deltaproteobacteria bacterium]MCW5804452.1 hypothetical protein [Deltaproteobacteria bacterium]
MRISWLAADEIAAARQALTAGGASYDDHFTPDFASPAQPEGARLLDWEHIAEHVARAERVSAVVRSDGLEAARARFGGSRTAIEAATLAAAAHESGELGLDEVVAVLGHEIDRLVFYAPFLELLVALGREQVQVERTVATYEQFANAYAAALATVPHGGERIGAVRDGLADFYVSVGRIDDAEALFERRHDEDQGDVAVALSASRAFLAAGSVSHAVRWLGVGAQRAAALGRDELAARLRQKQERVRERLS